MFKPLNLTAQVTYISSADPAVDWDAIVAAEIEADPEMRDDAKIPWEAKKEKAEKKFLDRFRASVVKNPSSSVELLKFKNGDGPTKFSVGVIPPDEMARIMDECRVGRSNELSQQAQWRAFLAAVRGIENFTAGPIPKRKVGDIEYADPAWLREKFSRGLMGVACGVGFIALLWNQLRDDDIKN